MVKPESSLAKNATVSATSSGRTSRRIGVAAASSRIRSAVTSSVALGPSTVPGATRLAVIPCGASSKATYRTNCSRAALAVPA